MLIGVKFFDKNMPQDNVQANCESTAYKFFFNKKMVELKHCHKIDTTEKIQSIANMWIGLSSKKKNNTNIAVIPQF